MNNSLNKTTVHLVDEANNYLAQAVKLASEARHIGSSRTKGYASIITFVASFVFGGAGFYSVQALKQAPSETNESKAYPTKGEMVILNNSLNVIKTSAEAIKVTKDRIAPAMQIDSNIERIASEAKTIKLILKLND